MPEAQPMNEDEGESCLRELTTPEKKRLSKLYDYIKASNRAFRRMSAAQKRVQIAKDVLKQLQIGRMSAASTYFSNFNIQDEAMRIVGTKPNTEVQDLFKQMPDCEVCGIGSCFVALVDREDRVKIKAFDGDLADRNAMVEYAGRRKVFTEKQLDLIETAFESIGFCPSGMDPNDRLRKIMKKIIADDGVINDDTFPAKYESYGY